MHENFLDYSFIYLNFESLTALIGQEHYQNDLVLIKTPFLTPVFPEKQTLIFTW